MRYAPVLFDLDGTLTDPSEGITNSLAHALRRIGRPVPDRAVLLAHIGPPLHVTFAQHYGCDEAQAFEAVALYREYFDEIGIYENALMPGIADLLAGLQQAECPIMIATSKPSVYAERIATHFGIAARFHAIIGSFLDGRRTGKAEVIAAALATMPEWDPARAVMVGDRVHDILGARANGIQSIGVTFGFGSIEELRDAAPAHIVASVGELRDLLIRD